MRPGQLLVLVEERRDPLDRAAVVGEDERRAMGADLLAEEPVDRRPDRLLRQRPELLDGVEDAQVEVLAQPRVDDADGPRADLSALVDRLAAKVARHFLQGALRGGEADADEGACPPLTPNPSPTRGRGGSVWLPLSPRWERGPGG